MQNVMISFFHHSLLYTNRIENIQRSDDISYVWTEASQDQLSHEPIKTETSTSSKNITIVLVVTIVQYNIKLDRSTTKSFNRLTP